MRRSAPVIVGLLIVGAMVAASGRSSVGLGQAATPDGTPLSTACAGEAIAPAIEVVLRLRPSSGQESNADELAQTRAVIARRAEFLSPNSCRVWTDGEDELLVQLAAATPPDAAVQSLAATGLLEIIDPEGVFLPEGTPVRTSRGDPALADTGTPAAGPVYQTIVDSRDTADAFITTNQLGQDVVGFELTPEAADRFCQFTTDNVGHPLSIAVDKMVVSSPIINTPICGGQGIVEGLDPAEVQALVVQLRTEPLPVPVEVVAVYVILALKGQETGEHDAGTIPGEQTFDYQGGNHAEGPIEYAEEPPVGGTHNPVWQDCGFYDEPIPNETAVHSLEHGAVWITYRPDLPADEVALLRRLAESDKYILVSPYPDLPAPVVVTSWNHQLRLESAADPRLEEFVRRYRRNPETTPELNAVCSGGFSGTRQDWEAALGALEPTTPALPTPAPTPIATPAPIDNIVDPTAGGCWTPAQIVMEGGTPRRWTAPPAMVIDPTTTYTALVETNMGAITIELDAAAAPGTVNNFVCLARSGYYDGTPVHRIVAGFVVQAGDPTGTGAGGPGYTFADEPMTGVAYEPGTVAMANAGPDTNGSQFFICLDDLSQRIPPYYTIFGRVVEGMDVVDEIAAVPVEPHPLSGESSVPAEPVTIERVTIVEGDVRMDGTPAA
jgi:cyclophilin family peptidyl-prolyl cis-trans isomerase